jgi:hypothetical protein
MFGDQPSIVGPGVVTITRSLEGTANKLSGAVARDGYARLVSFILIHLLY